MSAPVLNVNLAKCDTPHLCASNGGDHVSVCVARPVLIPCPIPRSATFIVALGECRCFRKNHVGREPLGHADHCPARPVRVSCSISGSTWEESEVMEAEVSPAHPTQPLMAEMQLLLVARHRWALVKALVLGASKVSEFPEPFRLVPAVSEMLVQRDAVYAALADMALAEKAAHAAQRELAKHRLQSFNVHRTPLDERPSASYLAAYVAHLVEQVGALS